MATSEVSKRALPPPVGRTLLGGAGMVCVRAGTLRATAPMPSKAAAAHSALVEARMTIDLPVLWIIFGSGRAAQPAPHEAASGRRLECLAFDEGQQIGVESVLMRLRVPVVAARVDLERCILQEFRRH